MDWGDIVPGILALLASIGFLLALRGRKRGGQKKLNEFYQHLQLIGIKSFIMDKGTEQEQIKQKISWPHRSEGVIKVQDRNIDYINIISVASQYGVNYFLDYLVKTPERIRKEAMKKTKMIRKKSLSARDKAGDIKWKGDPFLTQLLNSDYELKHKLEQANSKSLKGNIWIFPEPEHGYTRIRTNYHLPLPDIFEAIDTIARYIKSGI